MVVLLTTVRQNDHVGGLLVGFGKTVEVTTLWVISWLFFLLLSTSLPWRDCILDRWSLGVSDRKLWESDLHIRFVVSLL